MRRLVSALLTIFYLAALTPAQAVTLRKPEISDLSFIVAPDEMAAEPWKPGDDTKLTQVGFGGMFPGPGTVHDTGGGGSYTGIGDVVAAKHYWALRPYNATLATAGVAMFQLCTSAGASCNDIHATAAGGRNASDLALNSCDTSGTCIIKKAYDQIAGVAVDLTFCSFADGCPVYKNNEIGTGLPAGVPSGVTNYVVTGSISSITVPWSMGMVVSYTNPNESGSNVRLYNAPDPVGMLCCAASQFGLYASAVAYGSTTFSANTFYPVLVGTDGSGSGAFVNQDGTATTGLNAGSGSLSGAPGGNFMASGFRGGGTGAKFSEIIIWDILLNGTQQTNIQANLSAYWGI